MTAGKWFEQIMTMILGNIGAADKMSQTYWLSVGLFGDINVNYWACLRPRLNGMSLMMWSLESTDLDIWVIVEPHLASKQKLSLFSLLI